MKPDVSFCRTDKWQTWCMRSAEDGEKVIRFHSCPQKKENEMDENKNNYSIEEQCFEVDKLYNQGDYAECRHLLMEILEQEPGCGRAHYQLGNLYYMKLDDYEKAEYHLQLAMQFEPKYPNSYSTYLYLLNYLNRHKDLVKQAKRAIKIEGVQRFTIYEQLGKSFEKEENFHEARKAYRNALFATHDDDNLKEAKNSLKRIRKKRIMKWKNILF